MGRRGVAPVLGSVALVEMLKYSIRLLIHYLKFPKALPSDS